MASRGGISRKALRLYERTAIPSPPRRTEAGHRVYGRIRDIVARMQRITRLEVVDQSPALPERLDLTKSTTDGGTPTNL